MNGPPRPPKPPALNSVRFVLAILWTRDHVTLFLILLSYYLVNVILSAEWQWIMCLDIVLSGTSNNWPSGWPDLSLLQANSESLMHKEVLTSSCFSFLPSLLFSSFNFKLWAFSHQCNSPFSIRVCHSYGHLGSRGSMGCFNPHSFPYAPRFCDGHGKHWWYAICIKKKPFSPYMIAVAPYCYTEISPAPFAHRCWSVNPSPIKTGTF